MNFGEKNLDVGELSADQTVKLIKFVTHVYGEMGTIGELAEKGWGAFINILSTQHLYDLTAIILEEPKKEVQKFWTLSLFIEMISELSEANDLGALLGNLQRVVVAFQD